MTGTRRNASGAIGPRRWWPALGAAALLALAALPAGAQPPALTPGYRIGPKDLLEIRVFEVPELNVERRVSEDGNVNLPLIGNVPVEGLGEDELAARLKILLEAKYVQRASVAIQVREFRSKPISVLGAVRNPGTLAFSGRWSLMEAILACGGLTDQRGPKIFILRRGVNGLTDQVTIDVDDLLVRVDPDANLPIFSSDVINIPPAEVLTVFCLGEIGKPGAVTFKSTERVTLLTVIAQAGGLSDRASRKIRIKRLDASNRWIEMEVDYKSILSGKRADIELHGGDVVLVKESFF
jgi:polysaccharide export outer membrane protein